MTYQKVRAIEWSAAAALFIALTVIRLVTDIPLWAFFLAILVACILLRGVMTLLERHTLDRPSRPGG